MTATQIIERPNITFDCKGDVREIEEAGVITISVSLTGIWLNVTVNAEPVTITVTIPEQLIKLGTRLDADPITITVGFGTTFVGARYFRKSFVRWSKIGELDFTFWKDNVAGERPMDWFGWVYKIRKLSDKPVVYGENGVSVLIPVDVRYGLKTIYRIGLLGKDAMTGDDEDHYFIDKFGYLCHLGSKGIEVLDYSEFLSNLNSSTVMSMEPESGLIYICDGSLGYVYSTSDGSLGAGPNNITGIGSKSGTTYYTASGAITIPEFEIWVDIFDAESRGLKTISSMEFGIDSPVELYASLEFRRDKKIPFRRLPWRFVDPHGIVNMRCIGTEFKLGLKSPVYDYFRLDYIRINGVLNDK